MNKPLDAADPVLQAASPWSLYCWFQSEGCPTRNPTRFHAAGRCRQSAGRIFAIFGQSVTASRFSGWAKTTASFNRGLPFATGTGILSRQRSTAVASGSIAMGRRLPRQAGDWEGSARIWKWRRKVFPDRKKLPVLTKKRKICGISAAGSLVNPFANRFERKRNSSIGRQAPDPSLIAFEEGSKPWPIQTKEQAGYRAPQDPSSLPKSAAAFSRPVAGRFRRSRDFTAAL